MKTGKVKRELDTGNRWKNSSEIMDNLICIGMDKGKNEIQAKGERPKSWDNG